ncbi:hypothetical protein CEXT_285351 [Caerostris extrusa]|uniref:Uncharacterized protein n=1 Tax=Caerostris extrusa TaxID=172846 RepID=A0AAV4P6V0_CAEEX|nr:hypothetical protein CEXT_285351 [Caerostris extrusa]
MQDPRPTLSCIIIRKITEKIPGDVSVELLAWKRKRTQRFEHENWQEKLGFVQYVSGLAKVGRAEGRHEYFKSEYGTVKEPALFFFDSEKTRRSEEEEG